MNKLNYIFSNHLKLRLEKRCINAEWIYSTIENPDITENIEDNETHYFKKIEDFNGYYLKVVCNPLTNIIVTAYFDRKITKKYTQ